MCVCGGGVYPKSIALRLHRNQKEPEFPLQDETDKIPA